MKKPKKLKVKYVYIEPKTAEEKVQQQQILDDIFNPIFDQIIKNKLNE